MFHCIRVPLNENTQFKILTLPDLSVPALNPGHYPHNGTLHKHGDVCKPSIDFRSVPAHRLLTLFLLQHWISIFSPFIIYIFGVPVANFWRLDRRKMNTTQYCNVLLPTCLTAWCRKTGSYFLERTSDCPKCGPLFGIRSLFGFLPCRHGCERLPILWFQISWRPDIPRSLHHLRHESSSEWRLCNQRFTTAVISIGFTTLCVDLPFRIHLVHFAKRFTNESVTFRKAEQPEKDYKALCSMWYEASCSISTIVLHTCRRVCQRLGSMAMLFLFRRLLILISRLCVRNIVKISMRDLGVVGVRNLFSLLWSSRRIFAFSVSAIAASR